MSSNNLTEFDHLIGYWIFTKIYPEFIDQIDYISNEFGFDPNYFKSFTTNPFIFNDNKYHKYLPINENNLIINLKIWNYLNLNYYKLDELLYIKFNLILYELNNLLKLNEDCDKINNLNKEIIKKYYNNLKKINEKNIKLNNDYINFNFDLNNNVEIDEENKIKYNYYNDVFDGGFNEFYNDFINYLN